MFFVVESALATEPNSTPANAVFVKDTLDGAKVEFHTFLGYQISLDTIGYAMASILDENGNTIVHESWYRPSTGSEAQNV